MNENNMQIILDSLAETIRNLRVDVMLLKSENERLKETIKLHKEKGEANGEL